MSVLQVLIAIDQLGNALCGGMADETISAHAYRVPWPRRQRWINWLFRDPDHCERAFQLEVLRAQLPDRYRLK